MKKCTDCHVNKDLEEYSIRENSLLKSGLIKTYLNGPCKPCMKIRKKTEQTKRLGLIRNHIDENNATFGSFVPIRLPTNVLEERVLNIFNSYIIQRILQTHEAMFYIYLCSCQVRTDGTVDEERLQYAHRKESTGLALILLYYYKMYVRLLFISHS